MLQQLSIDWDNITHQKENNSFSEQILFDQYERLNHNCKIIYDALKRGERLTGRDIVSKYGMMEYRRRIADIRAAGIEVKEAVLSNGAKQWYL